MFSMAKTAEIFFVYMFAYFSLLKDSSADTCSRLGYYQKKYYTDCGFWSWSTCSKYSAEPRIYYYCCDGWTGYDCSLAICAGLTNLNHACEKTYNNDKITHRGGRTENFGGGSCNSPNLCTNCRDGFYNDGYGYCSICPQIDHCLHRRCDSIYTNHCEYCEGEIVDKMYWRAYTRHKDALGNDVTDMKNCIQTCSWRSDSTRCYPGKCDKEIANSCKCTDGFGGKHCQTIIRDPTILFALAKLRSSKPSDDPVETPVDPNDPIPRDPKWTNTVLIQNAMLKVTANFKVTDTPPAPDSTGKNHFVTEFKYGITSGLMKLTLIRDVNDPISPIFLNCRVNKELPTNDEYPCEESNVNFNPWKNFLPFQHNDRVIFSFEISNGGYLKYIDRDAYPENPETASRIRAELYGRTVVRNFIFHWDLVHPYQQCVVDYGLNCLIPPVITNDVTNQSTVQLEWNLWRDDMSSLTSYSFEVYELGSDGSALSEAKGTKVYDNNSISSEDTKSMIHVDKPGMYSVIFTAIDKAGNWKNARTLFLYDNLAVVESRPEKQIVVKQASVATNRVWVDVDYAFLDVQWRDKFLNKRHHANMWLSAITPRRYVEPEYDDHYGIRQTSVTPNVKGIVRFETKYVVLSPMVTETSDFVATRNVLEESTQLAVSWIDGDRLDIIVRAFDICNKYNDETVTVYKDTSPPEIENVWLSRGDRVNISVHSVEEFAKMTIEWNAFDYHSGLNSLEWRLFDNFTKIDVIHGHAHLQAQGDASNLTVCQEKYNDAPRGPDCYCTKFHGCFHKHFRVLPDIVKDAGLTPGNEKGVHDSDYFLEVSVVNKAMLKTVIVKKITIDISPPHEGTVHDGIKGYPEVDYQQDLHLDAHWEGFFDRESGVDFYKYIFSDHCLTNQEFKMSTQVKNTYNTYAAFDATVEGTYFVSVVAVNKANENSNIVCSDGVVITTKLPSIKDFIIEGAKTRPRIYQDNNGTVWFLDGDLIRHLVQKNVSLSCGFASNKNLEIFPVGRPVLNVDSSFCHAQTDYNILAVVSKSSQFKLQWKPAVESRLIFDYEVGLSSTADSIAPDIFSFRSTKQHEHFRVNHPDIPNSKEFYIVLKTISNSDVEGIQSVGPYIIDTTSPKFTGTQVDVSMVRGYLVANWSHDAFLDIDDPYNMEFQYAIGHQPKMYDVQQFQSIQFVGPCLRTIPPTCTAISIPSLKWSLHGHHEYYFTIKATNLAGLSVLQSSIPYVHDVQLPAKGIVLDVPRSSLLHKDMNDIEDIDFTADKESVAVKWSGFAHPHQEISFEVCLSTTVENCDIIPWKVVPSPDHEFLFSGLSLKPFQIYIVTVKASSPAGSVMVCSDGVRILDINTDLTGIAVKDGSNCSGSHDLRLSHHDKDTRPACSEDIDYQTSTTTLEAYWTIPDKYNTYFRDTFLAIEERLPIGDFWQSFRIYTYVGNHRHVTINDLNLKPGRFYRVVVKFCAKDLCFPAIYSNGVVVTFNPPLTGNLNVKLQNQSGSQEQLIVTFDKMRDPDIEDPKEALGVIWYYEWSIGDGVGLHTKWNEVDSIHTTADIPIQFIISFNGSIDFTKCRILHLRGYNKAGKWSEISAQIKQCNMDKGESLIVPNIVIDAIGEQYIRTDGTVLDGYGKDIHLEVNGRWTEIDVDYTPYKNILSATWPLLRHKNYTWAVIDAVNMATASYYKDESKLHIVDPCSHPDTVKCGHTDKEFINVMFKSNEELQHGKRFLVCIHAPKTMIEHEKWTEILNEVNTCSDGVTVDLTPPTPGHVWIGIDSKDSYQSSSSDLFVTWDAFSDVEEYKQIVHSSGIKNYEVGIGSTLGGTDIAPYSNVGLVNHYTFHNLRLQNGHEYYATVKAIDFSTRSSVSNSQSIKIDYTEPEKTESPVKINGRHLSDLSEINACWRDVFLDKESGIDYFEWAVGSRPGHDDIIPFTKTTLDCGVSAEDSSINIHEGHAYFITVKATNKAGLIATASSWAYIFDMSPPIAGHVYDGSAEIIPYMKDIDYQTDISTLYSSWEGFHDPHSTINTYYVSIGTCPSCEDVITNQNIGIAQNFTLRHMRLGSGIRYYTTITACNTADLCTSVTSDGVIVDNSPPTKGTIQDGLDVYDIEYQSLRNYISAKWYGFTDPQSGLDKFSWRVGTKPGADDIVTTTHLPVSEIVVEPDLLHQLPTGRRLYVTIKAYNKAGLSSEESSNGFVIDESPPVIKIIPYLATDLGSIKDNSVVFRNTIKVKWEVEDKESFIQRQYLSIASHKGGEFNSTSTELNGIVREFTFSRLDLHDGGNYTIKLIVCNGAKICIEDESVGIQVDSSPPTFGMFAIKTDHAADLHRHLDQWMTWSKYKLWLSWLGFSDIHTGIDKYFVSVGSKYMLDDLNKISGSPQEFFHKQSGFDKHDEGFVQSFEIDTKNMAAYEHVFVSVWALNGVGLSSQMIHSQFKLVPGGSLELIRRCSAITCLGHCVCAAEGRRCSIIGSKCNDITKGNPNSLLRVYDMTNIKPMSAYIDVKYSPSNVGLSSKWHVVQAQGLAPLWFEWSAGLTLKEEPEGIFDNLNEDVWHHAGQTNQAVLNLQKERYLKEFPVSYSIFVRVWYNDDTYADFKTDGVQVISKPLATRKLKAAAVVEQIPSHWKKDVDFIQPGSPYTIQWTNVFIANADIIQKFKLYLSTYPGGHDVHTVDVDLPGTITSYNISRVSLKPGIVFYSNVVAYSYSGIHGTETSDGVMVDSVSPTSGVVFDGIGLHDIDYQNSSEVIGATWHGFADRDSGITHYMWCVESKLSAQSCDIRDWENVGIQRSVSRKLNTSLSTGMEIKNVVYAEDLIGHKSKIVKSNGFIIDTTHPEPTKMEHLEDNVALNPSFEDRTGSFFDWENITNVSFCSVPHDNQALHWNYTVESCVVVLKSDKNIAMDGRSFIFVNGQISQTLRNLNGDQLYRVTFVTAHPPVLGSVFANTEGYVQVGNRKHVFMLYTKEYNHDIDSNNLDWHHHTFYFRVYSDEAIIIIGSMTGNTGILFDDIKVQQVILHNHSDQDVDGKLIHAHVVAIHQWSSVHASWSFEDPESPIVDYMWAIGYTEGSTEVQGFTSVGLSNFAYNYNVSLPHTAVVHITVTALNAAGLMREAHADDLLVDLTPPEILFVNDGIGSDVAAQTSDEISANWDVRDQESEVDFCEWAVGYQPYGNEIQAFEKLENGVKTISRIFSSNSISMKMIHVTLRCRNKAGLQSSMSSNGVKISHLPPDITTAEVQILPLSMTEYNARDHFQGNSSKVRIQWTGFKDLVGLDSFTITFQNYNKSFMVSKSFIAEDQNMAYCVLDGLQLSEGNYTANVIAANKMYLRSNSISRDVFVSTALPRLKDNPNVQMSVNNRTVTASWKNNFSTQQPIFYEVSAGLTRGGGDIVQWQETTNSFLEFAIPTKIKLLNDLTVFISVRGIFANGMNRIMTAEVKL